MCGLKHRRRSAAWTILLDWMSRSRTRASALWMTRAPGALLAVLMNASHRFKRIGLEAGPLSQWLFSALAEAGLPVICVATGGAKGTDQQDDRNDARGIAQMM